jgi:drug/metabolite transporter (DMT)-like permease
VDPDFPTPPRGAVFVAVYQPVHTLVVAIMASLTLGEKFYLGGIISAVLIIAGLFLVVWGKSEERARIARDAATLTMRPSLRPVLMVACMLVLVAGS